METELIYDEKVLIQEVKSLLQSYAKDNYAKYVIAPACRVVVVIMKPVLVVKYFKIPLFLTMVRIVI